MAVNNRFAFFLALFLVALAVLGLAMVEMRLIIPDADALAEETEIFNAEDAQWFGRSRKHCAKSPRYR